MTGAAVVQQVPHGRVCIPAVPLLILLSAKSLGKQKMAHVFGSLPPTWETQKRPLASGFGLAQHWLCGRALSV